MDGSNINLGNNFNRKDAEKKKYILAIFLARLPRFTPTYIHEEASNFHGASRFQYPGGRLIPKLTAMYTGVSTPEWTGG